MITTTGQKSLNCLEEGFIPVADSYIYFQSINSYCLEEVINMPPKGSKLSDEAKAHLSIIQKGKHLPDETKLKMSKAQKGKHLSEEHKQKLSEANKGNTKGRSGWFKQGHQTNLGRKHPEEFGRKISLRLKGKIIPEDVRKKMSEAMKGKSHPTSQAHLDRLRFDNPSNRPEVRLKISQSQIGKHYSPTTEFKSGITHPNWNGGRKISVRRAIAKRKRELGFIILNAWEVNTPGFVGHHLDKEYVLYIPEELHKLSKHRQDNQASMDRINDIVMKWYVEYYGLI